MARNGRMTVHGAMLLALVSQLGAGCSLIFVRPPTPVGDGRYVSTTCTTSQAAPVVDTALTGLQLLRTAFAFGASEQAYNNGMVLSRESDIALGAVFTGVHLGSAIYGYTMVGKCREVRGDGSPGPSRRPLPTPTRDQRRWEDAAEEAAVQARARAIRDAQERAAREPIVAPVDPVPPDGGVRPPDGGAP